MNVEKIRIWDDCDNVVLCAYILDNSQEFKKDHKRPAVVICPGGAYLGTSDREAEPVAMRFAALGYNTFVLRYNTYFSGKVKDYNNLPPENSGSVYPGPLYDLAKAMKIIRENSDKWFIDSDKIVVCGFSAGAHLAASLAVHWQDDFLMEKLEADSWMFRPNAVILGYPLLDYNAMKEEIDRTVEETYKGLWELSCKAVFGKSSPDVMELGKLSPVNYISAFTPPVFIWHTADDDLVYVSNSLNFASELSRNRIPYELHIFESGVHGLSLCDETTARDETHINPHCSIWFDLAAKWLRKHI